MPSPFPGMDPYIEAPDIWSDFHGDLAAEMRAELNRVLQLRGGERPRLERPVPPAPYYVTLSRVNRRPYVDVWPIQLWEKLPVLPVPLLDPDPDATLDLSAVTAAVYERGAYALLIDYHRPPPPPALSDTEAIWLDEHLRAQRVR
jgi:Protein of unknown function (DUF4058)